MERSPNRFRWLTVSAWLVAAVVVLSLLAPKSDRTIGESKDLLPPSTPVHVGLDELARHFEGTSGLSSLVVVFERQDAKLTAADFAEIERVGKLVAASRPGEKIEAELKDSSFRTPASLAIAGANNPLVSADGHAALISGQLPFNYITKPAARLVKHAQEIVADQKLPAGLVAQVTGSAGYGYDYAVAIEHSHKKTLIVTIAAVVLILLAVYRAPLLAAIPLVAISLAAGVTFQFLAIGSRFGIHSGTAEQIFTFVLLYGAGVDYSLLTMSRYREFLDEGHPAGDAIALAARASLGAIVSSAIMTACGVSTLCFARFSVFRDAGPAVVLAVIIAALAATTLTPALLAIAGPRAFWPGKLRGTPAKRTLWPAIAKVVAGRPAVVMIVTLAVLIPPAIRGLNVEWNYDALYSLKAIYPARQGTQVVERHWPTGEIAPLTVLVVADRPTRPDQWFAAATQLTTDLRALPGVANIRALPTPFGLQVDPVANASFKLLGQAKIRSEYLSPDGQAMRLSVVLGSTPLSHAAMDQAAAIALAATRSINASHLDARVHLTGVTAEMIDIRALTQQDFHRILGLAVGAILVVLILVLRDVLLSIFILAATLLSYLATVGLTVWCFRLVGASGLEWKVQMLLFVVLVAVGQDYSIFFAVRLAQERLQRPTTEAMQQALIFTGPVISSCGLIMAATLGSLMSGDVRTLVELGFALALGMLIDTFIVRPLLLPTFVCLRGSTTRQ